MTSPLTLVLFSVFSSTSSIYVFSNYGTSFYLGFIRQEQVFTSPRIIIGTNSTSKVSFAVKSSNATLAVGETTFSSTYTVALPSSWFTMNSSYSERYKGLHISASAPIYVLSSFYKVVRESNTSGASVTHLALPEHNLGADTYEYIAVSSHIYLRNYWNVVLLIGNENNTSITVTSPAFVTFPLNPQDPDSGTFRLQAGNPYTLTLNRFQTLLFGKDGNFNKPVRNDMTGTRILSNKPLTVISGAECAYRVSFEYTCEPIAVQIPPLVTLGTRFLMAPVVGRTSGEVYKVVPAHLHQTDVHLTCTESKQMLETLSGLGAYVEFTTTSSDYCYLESSLPVLLVQLALTQQRKEQLGDTSMIFIPSMDQYSNQFFFRTPTGYPSDNDDLTHFLSVVVPSGSLPLSQIVYNGQPISFPWSAIRNSNGSVVGYSCGFSISAGVHSLQHTDLSKSILGIAYGYGAGQAYGYPTGITQRIGSVKFSQSEYLLSEDDSVFTVSLEYMRALRRNVKIKLILESGTGSSATSATTGEDFHLLLHEVMFTENERTKNMSLIAINDDKWVETTEKFSIRLLTENDQLLGSLSTFLITDNDYITVGITSTRLNNTSPHYFVEICVSITNGVLEFGTTATIILTVTTQEKGNEMATSVTLQFTHYFTHICPKINLLPLVNPTEIPKKPTLTASLAANDTVHVILNPSATKINDKKITLISVPLVVVLVCFAAIMIIITVIVRCYYHRAISLRNETCSIKPPAIEEMYQTKGASYELDTWVHDDVKTKGSLAIKKMNLTDSTSDHLESQTSIHDDDIRTLVPPVITEKNQADGTSTDNDTRTYDHCRTMEPEIYQANGTNADLDTGIYDENGTTKSPVITEMNQANGTSDDLDTRAYDHIEPRNHQ